MRVLFKRDMGFGDIIMLSGCIKEAKKRYKDAEIVLQTKCPEVATLIPSIDQVVNYDITADVVCDMNMIYEKRPNSPVWVAFADYLFGKYELQDIMPSIELGEAKKIVNEKHAIIHACKSSPSRTLPKDKWEQIAQGLKLMGYAVIVVGSGEDFALRNADTNLIDELSLAEIGQYLKGADLFVGIDSGIMHIAQATDVPIIAIFSIASPDFRVWREKDFYSVCPSSDCRFCLSKIEPTQSVLCDTLDCVKSITAKDVLYHVKRGLL